MAGKTKAAVGAPKTEFVSRLQDPPTAKAADNMSAARISDMSFKVSEDFHRKFKMTATGAGLSMKGLLEESFEAWINSRKAN